MRRSTKPFLGTSDGRGTWYWCQLIRSTMALDGEPSTNQRAGKAKVRCRFQYPHLQSSAMTKVLLGKLELFTAARWIKGTSAPIMAAQLKLRVCLNSAHIGHDIFLLAPGSVCHSLFDRGSNIYLRRIGRAHRHTYTRRLHRSTASPDTLQSTKRFHGKPMVVYSLCEHKLVNF